MNANHRHIAMIIGGLAAIGPFSIDTYFPSFPALAQHFGVTELAVQSTLSWYLAAFAGMNLFHGSLSDSFGRRRVILAALALYTLSSLGCLAVPNFGCLLALRMFQGLASGAGVVVSQALIRDRFEGTQAQQFLSEVIMVSALGPALAPILGGWLHLWFGWRGSFLFLTLMGSLLWGAVYLWVQETLPSDRRQPFHPKHLFNSYMSTIRHPGFLMACLTLAFGSAGFLLYVATASDVVVHILGLSETQFGWLFMPIVAGMALGTALTKRLGATQTPAWFIKCGFSMMALAAVINLAVNLTNSPRVIYAVMPLTLYSLGYSFVAPLVTIQGLDLFPKNTGLASSLQGFCQTLLFALLAGPLALLVARSGFKHAVGLALLMVLSCSTYCAFRICLRRIQADKVDLNTEKCMSPLN